MQATILGAFAAAVMLLSSTGVTLAMSENYMCGTDRIDLCSCAGSADCRDMRKSGMCSGPMVCNAKGCSCAVINMVGGKHKPGGVSGAIGAGTAGMRPVNGTGKSPQSPPVLKFKPLLPGNSVRMK